jgi:hypothetical protein
VPGLLAPSVLNCLLSSDHWFTDRSSHLRRRCTTGGERKKPLRTGLLSDGCKRVAGLSNQISELFVGHFKTFPHDPDLDMIVQVQSVTGRAELAAAQGRLPSCYSCWDRENLFPNNLGSLMFQPAALQIPFLKLAFIACGITAHSAKRPCPRVRTQ